jgi:ABC-2 type transport system permease protein
MRIVQGGSSRMRHLYIRAGYLAVIIVVLFFALMSSAAGQSLSVRQLAANTANTFTSVSYLQVGLICLLTPVFMAGAIAQEANPRTWDILLTTPLNSAQIVLGNLFGRLFFILALLFSTLPLFMITQYFGGVPGSSIFDSYAIAGSSSLVVAAVAITLSVTRTAGKRAVLLFYTAVVMYLFITYAADLGLRRPVGAATTVMSTTIITPLNPFLALEVLLKSNQYVAHTDLTPSNSIWPQRMWMGRPVASFCWLCVILSLALIAFSTLRLRVIGTKVGHVPWYRRLLGVGAKGASERPARHVGHNPISWREATARGSTFGAIAARWGFVALGVLVALVLLTVYHTGLMNAASLRLAVGAVVGAEVVIISLTGLNMSATAVSREREDGTLDLILTTPIQPGAYIAGKLRGLIQFLLPMMLVPVLTMLLIGIYVMTDGLGTGRGTTSVSASASTLTGFPVILPEGALALPLLLIPFVAFCVMVGLQWSIKSKGTIGSVIAAVAVVLAVIGVLSLCGVPMGDVAVLGPVINAFSPINLLRTLVAPEQVIEDPLADDMMGSRIAIVIGAAIAGAIYAAIVAGMHSNIKKTFMTTVRRLAGHGAS